MSFISSYIPPEGSGEPAWWFVFQDDRMLVHVAGERVEIPKVLDPGSLYRGPLRTQYLGALDGVDCYAAALDGRASIDNGMALLSLREIFGRVPDDLLRVAARAFHVLYWDSNTRFCSRCGRQMQLSSSERAKQCPSCGFTSYPRISPAVIVAVVKDDKILLAHAGRFPSNFYSVLAGFVEPGETFEECIVRELKEEVGIDVKNIRYFASQPWPFPDSLMTAFTAEYAGGEIHADGVEITDARWFAADELPDIPGKFSVARQLIDWFVGRSSRTSL